METFKGEYMPFMQYLLGKVRYLCMEEKRDASVPESLMGSLLKWFPMGCQQLTEYGMRHQNYVTGAN